MWFAENKSWSEYRRSLGGFSAIVCKDGSTVWAEDASGKTIASGESGVDDASVIQSALNQGGKVFISAGTYRIPSGVLEIPSNVHIAGEGIDKTVLQIYYYSRFPSMEPHTPEYVPSAIKNKDEVNGDENIIIRDLTLENDITGLDENSWGYRTLVFHESRNITIERVKFYKMNPGHYWSAGGPGQLFFLGDVSKKGCSDVIVRDCIFINQSTGTDIDTMTKYEGYRFTIENCYVDARAADGSRLVSGHCFNIAGVYDSIIKGCRGFGAEAGIWIELGNLGNYNEIDIRDCIFWQCKGGIGHTDTPDGALSADSKIKISGCRVYNVDVWGIKATLAEIVNCEVYNHASNTNHAAHGIYGKIVINSRVESSSSYARGLSGEIIIGCYSNCPNGWDSDPYKVSYRKYIGNRFEGGGINLRGDAEGGCTNILILGNTLKTIQLVGGDKIIIIANKFISGGSGVTYATTVPTNVLVQQNDFIDASATVHADILAEPTNIIRRNIGYTTENSGTATFSGDGTTTQFSIAHGLVSTPTKVLVTPMTADAASDFYVTTDDTNIYINYKSAPPSGTDNLKFSWYAEV